MATPYSLWSKSKRKPARVTWVAGDEPELVRDVCMRVRAAITPATVLFASVTPEPDIWSACMQFPLPGQQRLVVVHDAGQLKQLDTLEELLEAIRAMQGAYVLFTGEGWPDAQDAVQRSPAGQVVRCSFTSDEVKARQDKAVWLSARLPGATTEWAHELLDRVDGDFPAAAVVCAKAALCGLSPGQAMHLAAGQAQPPFADLLVLGERKAALRAATVLGREDYGRVTAQLASRLTVMSTLYRVVQDSPTGQPLHKLVPDVPAFLVKRFRKAAPLYSPQRVQAQRELLDIADSAYRRGAKEGVLELLCAGW